MKTNRSVERYYQRLNTLKKQLGSIELVLPGTIYKRVIVKDNPESSRPIKKLGPYYQWTWKKKGKSVTINLTKEQAKLYQNAIDNQREVDKIIKEMRAVSLEILENTTKCVKRKKVKKIEF